MRSHELAPPPVMTVDVCSPSHTLVLSVDPGDITVVGSPGTYGSLERQKVPGRQHMFAVSLECPGVHPGLTGGHVS
jgi:hypothetical protein